MEADSAGRDAVRADSYAQRLRLLIDAGIFLSSELHLDDVLDRIVQTASSVIGARYAALGVLNEEGTGLSTFVFTGLTAFDRQRIGRLPRGQGLLGALIADPRPIRLADIAEDSRSVGFPVNHPPMTSFLGVPIRAKGKVFGNLYLTEKQGAPEFSEEDERLVLVLAAQAGAALENARLYEDARRAETEATSRRHALELVQEVGRAVVSELDPARVLRLIAGHARKLVGAAAAFIALQEDADTDLVVRVATGAGAGSLEGMRVPLQGSLAGVVVRTLEPLVADDAASDARAYSPVAEAAKAQSMIVVPLVDSGKGVGVLAVLHPERTGFHGEDVFAVSSFADLASIALQNARAVAAERDRAQLETELAESQLRESMRTQTLRAVIRAQEDERQRIARELHDSFGQSLASILLGLKVAQGEADKTAADARLDDLRSVAAAAASEVRRIAFELRPNLLDELGLGPALQRLAGDVEQRAGIAVPASVDLPRARLDPDVETVVYRVAQEAMTNAIKYAGASEIAVSAAVESGEIRLVVSDNGHGFDVSSAETSGLGLLGMRERAELVGGKLWLRSERGSGTTVELRIPVPAETAV